MANTPMELVLRDLQRQGVAVGDGVSGPVDGPPRSVPVAPPSAQHASAAIRAGIAAGNINIADKREALDFSDEAAVQANRTEELLADFERRKQARNINVPTDDGEVVLNLRALAEPVCLFGEGPAERRDRLREVLLRTGQTSLRKRTADDEPAAEHVAEVWYHVGPPELINCRREIAEFSLPRARERLKRARLALAKPDPEAFTKKQQLTSHLRAFGNTGSQVGDTRPVAFCEYSPNGAHIASAGWSGLCKLWAADDLQCTRSLRGHAERAGCITWHPQATLTQDVAAVNLASSDIHGNVHLWSLEEGKDTPLASLGGHHQRVPRVRFHPGGGHLATTCFDHSWRLWDLTSQKELLHQEGHSRSVFDVDFHPDGSLVGTTSMDAIGRVWDLRTGKCVVVLSGHVKPVVSLRFAPNGYQLATGSDDHTVRLWDLRRRKSYYTLPAHKSIVSCLRYSSDGEVLVSAAFDNTIKLWSLPNCTPLKTLEGHDAKVMCVDVSPAGGHTLVSAGYDRTLKLWTPDALAAVA